MSTLQSITEYILLMLGVPCVGTTPEVKRMIELMVAEELRNASKTLSFEKNENGAWSYAVYQCLYALIERIKKRIKITNNVMRKK